MQISTKLAQILSALPSTQGNTLVRKQLSYAESDVDYIDYKVTNGNVFLTFFPKSRLAGEVIDPWTDRKRQESKVGKLIKKLMPTLLNDVQLASFVKDFTGTLLNYSLDLKTVDGEAIAQYYYEENYDSSGPVSGSTLHKSCMRYEKCGKFFGIYENNPDACKLLIGSRGAGLRARALIWQALDEADNPITIMDRIYYVHPLDEKVFKDWCFEQGYILRVSRTDFQKTPDGKLYTAKYKVPITSWRFRKYPYLDTFAWLLKGDTDQIGTLTNFDQRKKFRHLQHGDGAYTDSDGDYAPPVRPGFVWVARLDAEFPVADIIHIDDVGYLRSELSECGLCNDLHHTFITVRKDGADVKACIRHQNNNIIQYQGVTWTRCLVCNKYTSEGELCAVCVVNTKKCACGKPLIHSYDDYSHNGEPYCPPCFFEKFDICYVCEHVCSRDNMNDELICKSCQK